MNAALGTAERLLAASGLARASVALTQSLPEQIAARLSERIVSGAYAPAQRIMEQALAAEFAVSRGPVREALRILERDGLVTILPRRGALVTNLSITEVKEIFDIRAMLNGLRDRLIAEDPDREKVLAVLESEVARLTRLAKDPKRGQEYVEVVWSINRILTEACANARLKNILDSLARQTLRYSQLGLATPERRRQSVQHWENLVQAIRGGDGAAAERIARERVTDSRDGAIRALQEAMHAAPPLTKRRNA
ncbi:MAG TPA: GntR family transcriptional regulator [Burkholderiales bacterium]|jgi:DNA-binding GntR family transcriptional regulator|nr:GntR family transcriptional regulator [Burkholderiales bacterium]